MRPLILLCVVTGAGLVYLMSQASSNTTLFTQNYPALLGLGGLLSLGLMLLIEKAVSVYHTDNFIEEFIRIDS